MGRACRAGPGELMYSYLKLVLLPAALLLLASCAGGGSAKVRPGFDSGRYQESREKLTRLGRKDPRNEHLYLLERGVVSLALEQPADAVRDLRLARDRLDDLAGSDYSGWFQSVLLDDRQLAYQGADYEHVLVRAMLALADLADGNSEDAGAYALQVASRQREIIQSFRASDGSLPKSTYSQVAFGSYLKAIIDEEALKFDLAKIQLEKVKAIEPRFAAIDADLERVTRGHHSRKGNGVVHVLALVGRGPFRIEVDEPVTRDSLAIAHYIWARSRNRAAIPNIARVKIPAVAVYDDNPTEVHVEVAGGSPGTTSLLTDIEALAVEEFETVRDHIVARAFLRRAFKVAATQLAIEAANRDNDKRGEYSQGDALRDLGISAAGLLWTALEKADLRCWSLLPASFQARRVELPEGVHSISLRAGKKGVLTGAAQQVKVHVRDGYNTYVVAVFPSTEGPACVLSSDTIREPSPVAEPSASP